MKPVVETSITELDRGWMLVRHTPISKLKRTILCLHGLGDSSLAFSEAFQSSQLERFNVIAPDLLGHGGSSGAPDGDYSFAAQIKGVNRIIDEFQVSEFLLVGHSLGADIATHLTANDLGRVRGLVNVEGKMTLADGSEMTSWRGPC